MDASEILAKAAEDQAQYGHTKEVFYDSSSADGRPWETAPACAFGSLARVTKAHDHEGILDYDLFESEAVKKLAATIRGKLSDDYEKFNDYLVITTYNDLDSTTGEDIILAMKEAAHG